MNLPRLPETVRPGRPVRIPTVEPRRCRAIARLHPPNEWIEPEKVLAPNSGESNLHGARCNTPPRRRLVRLASVVGDEQMAGRAPATGSWDRHRSMDACAFPIRQPVSRTALRSLKSR